MTATATDQISSGERRELRAIVRRQFSLLRSEVTQRETELMAEAEALLAEKYRDDDRMIKELNNQIGEIAKDAQRQVDRLMQTHGLTYDVRWGDGKISHHTVQRRTDGSRMQLRRVMQAGIKSHTQRSWLVLTRQETDMLQTLALGSLKSRAAKTFLGSIPTVAALFPATLLQEIEAGFDAEHPKENED